ncbi:MAG: HesA/MoeB/ThiF family protein, partial [Gammaproteobacteria bacterium]|nr:HesA/MoeB/ThiF family protein [Gammaproteobacteria bacterium]
MSSERYSRHLLLSQIGESGQARLLKARVLVIGLGGLGSPVAMYLAASGVGELVLVDFDHVELSNLQRQVIHSSADIGRDKVASARDRVLALNPEVKVTTLAYAPEDHELAEEISKATVVVDASDNFETRFTLNALCHRAGVPLVSGAAIRMEG